MLEPEKPNPNGDSGRGPGPGVVANPAPEPNVELSFDVKPATMLRKGGASPRAIHVLVLGQSNAASHSGARMKSSFGRVLHQGQFFRLNDPVKGGTGDQGSVWTRFAPLMEAAGLARDLIVSMYAVGGTSMADWSLGGGCYEALRGAIPSIHACPVAPTHVVFHQGERDNLLGTAPEEYVAQFDHLYTLLNRAFPKVGWIFCRATYRAGVTSDPIREAQGQIVARYPNIHGGPDTDAWGEDCRWDNTHFNDIGLSRFAEALVQSFAALNEIKGNFASSLASMKNIDTASPEAIVSTACQVTPDNGRDLPVRTEPVAKINTVETKGETRLIVACMPKSGSTFLTELIASLPGMRRATLVPGYQRREQELCLERLNEEVLKSRLLLEIWRGNRERKPADRPRGFVSQMHIRLTETTSKIMDKYQILPIVLVRNIFDIVVSLRDHIVNSAPYMSMGYVTEEMRLWPEQKMYHFLADMVVPWYVNFFMCWTEDPRKLLVTYEELTNDPEGITLQIAKYAGIPIGAGMIRKIINGMDVSKTRKNKAVAGRGESLPTEVKEKIRNYANYYTSYDLSPMGL